MFYQKGYEQKLIDSIARTPTMLTAWMLNRVINGTQESATRELLVSTMRQAATNPKTDGKTVERITGFLERLNP
jgi:hypothetical protein